MSQSYFSSNYQSLAWPIATGAHKEGFRNAQLGALHSIGSHFTIHSEPAIVTMPTGSGKTAVLIAAAFLLRANRVLVITPSRLVREQITEQFEELDVLKKIKALPDSINCPKVLSTRKRLGSEDEWKEMKDYDVVVGTLPSISPSFENIPNPPSDLFDLVLVDEAHHSPARTWKGIIEAFSDAKKILLTATPFRRDKKEIKGKLIYSYSLSKAYQDGIFGEISYIPVKLNDTDDTSDVAIAKAANRQYQEDVQAGFNHRIMVRTDSKKRATELLSIYQEHTDLKLKVVKGEHTLRHVKSVINSLSDGKLDGIICVDMLGEGFDFPSLKIAAVHSPHKSLAVTLQFIGRFTRTTGAHLGAAKFIAVPSEIKIESERLYQSGTVWQEMIATLSSTRVEKETAVREALDTFEKSVVEYEDDEFDDMSLYTIEPYHHIKVYSVSGNVDLNGEINWPKDIEIIHNSVSYILNTAIYLTKEVKKSGFSKDGRFDNIEHDAFIIYHDEDTNLVFLCFTRRTLGFYDLIMQGITSDSYRILSLNKVNRALNGLKNYEFFNVGMRNRLKSSTSESYRMISGSSADKAIQRTDAKLYNRGHCFGSARDNGLEVTIGISSSSKIWSNKSSQIPELITWCKSIARKVSSNSNENTKCGLDLLSVGQDLHQIPENVMFCDWNEEIYKGNYSVEFCRSGKIYTSQLLDCDIEIDYESITDNDINFRLIVNSETFPFKFSITGGAMFSAKGDNTLLVKKMGSQIPLEKFLNDYPLIFYTGDLSSFHGVSFMPAHDHENYINFDSDNITAVDWGGKGVDVTNECKPDSDKGISIHSYLSKDLEDNKELDVVYFDHGTGEIADFISVNKQEDTVLVKFYHCKKAGGSKPGDRVEDAYGVCGQSIKCTIFTRPSKLFERISNRFNGRKGESTFIKGNLELLRSLICETPPASIKFSIIAVQPGISAESITPKVSNILASVDDYLIREVHSHFEILGS